MFFIYTHYKNLGRDPLQKLRARPPLGQLEDHKARWLRWNNPTMWGIIVFLMFSAFKWAIADPVTLHRGPVWPFSRLPGKWAEKWGSRIACTFLRRPQNEYDGGLANRVINHIEKTPIANFYIRELPSKFTAAKTYNAPKCPHNVGKVIFWSLFGLFLWGPSEV